MGSTCFNWFCDRTIVKPIMCEESLSSLFFCLQLRSAGNRSTFGATGSEAETRPKGFRERINVYPLVGFSKKNRRVNIYHHF